MPWTPTATDGATSGAAWPMSWPRPRTSLRARDGRRTSPGASRSVAAGFRSRPCRRRGAAGQRPVGGRGRADHRRRAAAGVCRGAVLLPAGARGPAFLVGPNFRAILRYNNSTSYALAVGLLAQRLAGGPGVQAPWPRDLVGAHASQLTALQTALNQRGFDERHARRHDGAGHAWRNPRLSAQRRLARGRLSHPGAASALAGPVAGLLSHFAPQLRTSP